MGYNIELKGQILVLYILWNILRDLGNFYSYPFLLPTLSTWGTISNHTHRLCVSGTVGNTHIITRLRTVRGGGCRNRETYISAWTWKAAVALSDTSLLRDEWCPFVRNIQLHTLSTEREDISHILCIFSSVSYVEHPGLNHLICRF